MAFEKPPLLKNDAGQYRKIGFELEFSGIEFTSIICSIKEVFGGQHKEINHFLHHIEDTPYGKFVVEMDSRMLTERTYAEFLKKNGIDIDEFSIQANINRFLINLGEAVLSIVGKEKTKPLQPVMERLLEWLSQDDNERVNPEDWVLTVINLYRQGREKILEHGDVFAMAGINVEKLLDQWNLEEDLTNLLETIREINDSPRFSMEEQGMVEKLRNWIQEQDTLLRNNQIQLEEVTLKSTLENLLEKLASTMVPYEIASPPIPMPDFDKMEQVRKLLHERHAQGSKSNVLFAFGLHFNPEISSDSIDSVLRHFQAFLLLYDWMFVEAQIDLTRRIAPFIDEFPYEYIIKVLHPDYKPDWDTFIRDYLKDNPTRNRPLDLLPLFAWKDEKTIREQLPQEKINKRPTWHFRLPNCLIDEADWSLNKEWLFWVMVERLAAPEVDFSELSQKFIHMRLNSILGTFRGKWHQTVAQWLEDKRL